MRSRLTGLALVVAVLLMGCASDGRGLGSANNNNKSIQRESTTTADSSPTDFTGDFTDETLPGESDTDPFATDPGGEMSIAMPFDADAPIPAKYTCDGPGLSPAITWANLPEGTVEVAVQVIDLEAENFTHWVITGLKPASGGLGEGQVPVGAIQATNTHGTIGYFGPCPPKGSTHNYLFEVDAMDSHITLANGTDADTMLQAVGASTIQSASNTGNVTR